MRSIQRVVGILMLASLTILSSLFMTGSGSGSERRAPRGGPHSDAVSAVQVRHQPKSSIGSVRKYWTSHRMRRADQWDVPERIATASVMRASAASEGVPGSYPASPPATPPSSVQAPHVGPLGAGTEYFWPLDQYAFPPALTEGKVFFSWNGGNYVCSATVVNSRNRSLVWTAGHCVVEKKQWSKRMMFCPAYIDGACPHGEWVVRRQYTTDDWFSRSNFSYDVAATVMYRRGGERIVDALGGQGIAWNQPRSQSWTAIGYPAAPPFDGQRLYACEDGTKRFLNPPRPGPDQTGIDCSMTGGSSGGAWLIRLDDTGFGSVNGVTSLGIDATDELFSPYHGNEARRLWRDAGSWPARP